MARRILLPHLLAVALVFPLVFSGCSNTRPLFSLPKPGTVVVLFDVGQPGFLARESQFQELDSLAKSAGEAGCIFDLWSYDTKPYHLWLPNQIPTVDMLDSTENNDLKHRDKRVAAGNPGLALATVEATAVMSNANGRLYILSDGSSDDPAALASALNLLAAKPGWRLAVLGIKPENQPKWKAAMASSGDSSVDLIDSKTAVSLLAQNRDE